MSDIKKLAQLIKDIKFAMLTTISPHGELRSRPMTLQSVEFDGNLWFFAGRSTPVVLDIAAQPRVNLAFTDINSSSFISVTGLAEVVKDKEKEKELWSPLYKAWFSAGLEDIELCLIRVHVDSADYWETPHSKVVQMYGFAKAILTGEKVKHGEVGQHGHLTM